jgi:hypothetical protein
LPATAHVTEAGTEGGTPKRNPEEEPSIAGAYRRSLVRPCTFTQGDRSNLRQTTADLHAVEFHQTHAACGVSPTSRRDPSCQAEVGNKRAPSSSSSPGLHLRVPASARLTSPARERPEDPQKARAGSSLSGPRFRLTRPPCRGSVVLGEITVCCGLGAPEPRFPTLYPSMSSWRRPPLGRHGSAL